jgi:hypothetical protein
MSFSNNFPTTNPTLELDFANVGALDPRITFTRANPIATVTNSLGLIQTVGANVPRFDYDPVTLAAKGLLIEEQRTNLLTYSEQFDNAVWNKGTNGSINANTVVAPDGSVSADEYIWATSTSAFAFLMQSVSGNPTNPHTYSLWLKRPAGSGSRNVRLAISDITIGSTSSSDFTVTETWQRFSFTRTSANSTGLVGGGLGAGLTNPIVAGEILHVWGAQLEAGSFATSYIPSTQTFTGRTSTGTFIGSNGLIQTASSGVARFQYNPLNLSVAPFLLLEAAATNLLTYSEQFDNAAWTKTGLNTTGTPSWVNVAVAPDGTTTSDKLIATTANSTHRTYQAVSKAAAAQTLTFSCYVKAAGYGFALLRMFDSTETDSASCAVNLTTGEILTAVSGFTGVSGSAVNVGNSWWRVSVTATTDAETTVQPAVFIQTSLSTSASGFTGNDSDGLFVWGAQLEANSFATSYMPTVATTFTRSADTSTSAQTTRSADVASVNTLSPWYNATEGTLYAEYTPYAVTSDSRFASIDDNTSANRIMIWGTASSARTIFNTRISSVDQADLQVSSTYTTSTSKAAGSYKVNDFAFSVNGGAVLTDTSGTIPTVTQLVIGSSGSSSAKANGTIRKLAYYPVRLSNTNLQALTS